MSTSVTEPKWYGKPKFHYVVKRSTEVLYRCTSVAKYQEDVLDELVRRFKGEKNVIRIFCNKKEVAVLNRSVMPNKIYLMSPS